MWSALFAALVLAGAPQSASAQDPEATTLDDVVVEARRVEDAARAFVEEVGAPPPGTRPGRWNSDICVSVTGMQPQYAQYLIDRIAIAALDAGVEVQGPGCRPNVVVFATNDGAALGDRLVSEAGLGFRPALNGTNLGRDALRHFRTSAAPVRWWHVTMPVEISEGQMVARLKGEDPPTVTVRDASRLRSNIRYDIAWAIIIVDMNRTGGVPFGALADYVALASLTQLDPFADMSNQDTILNLFQPASNVTTLTDWDKDYLSALYSARADRANNYQQMNDLVTQLTRTRTGGQGQQQDVDAPTGD